jgi:hypothetical protein
LDAKTFAIQEVQQVGEFEVSPPKLFFFNHIECDIRNFSNGKTSTNEVMNQPGNT